jgi:D-alanyl-D-alanine carboxypeptidase/D-alanyl-D-alanine-endopeptidase (penicillin-binding protein 4)
VLGQLRARDDAPLLVHQIRQRAVLVAGQRHRLALERHPRLAGIERDVSAAQLGRRVTVRPPHHGPHAGQHFFHAERLGHVVVGAAVDTQHLLRPGAARGQDDHRNGNARLAPAAEQREAVDVGQAEVEQDGAVLLGAHEEVGTAAVAGDIHRVAGLCQCALHLRSKRALVLDHQNPHG